MVNCFFPIKNPDIVSEELLDFLAVLQEKPISEMKKTQVNGDRIGYKLDKR